MSRNQVLHCLNGHRIIAYSLQLLICLWKSCGNVSEKAWRYLRESRARFFFRTPLQRPISVLKGSLGDEKLRRVRFTDSSDRCTRDERRNWSIFRAMCIARTSNASMIHRLATTKARGKMMSRPWEKNEERKSIEEAANAGALVTDFFFSFSLSFLFRIFFLL